MPKHLRAVEPGESAPAPILTLSEAVESGDYLAILRAQRRDIVRSLPDEKGPAKAALHRQLSMISKEIGPWSLGPIRLVRCRARWMTASTRRLSEVARHLVIPEGS